MTVSIENDGLSEMSQIRTRVIIDPSPRTKMLNFCTDYPVKEKKAEFMATA